MPSEGHPPHQLAAYCLPNGVHKPTDPKNDLASQWVIVTSEYTAKMTVIRAAIKIAPIQFIAASPPHLRHLLLGRASSAKHRRASKRLDARLVGSLFYPSFTTTLLARCRIDSSVRLHWLRHRGKSSPVARRTFLLVGFAIGFFIWCFSGAAAGRIASSAAPWCPRVWQVHCSRPARQRTDGARC